MTLTVLSNSQVENILESLSSEQLTSFRQSLSQALHEFSTGVQAGPDGPYQQPPAVSTTHATSHTKSLYASSSGPEGMSSKVTSTSEEQPPTSTLTLYTPTGQPSALISSTSLTPFRTALSSSCLLARRTACQTLTVFGCGSQAYWHIRLALKARGASIRKINIINHRFSDNAKGIMRRFAHIPQEVKREEGWNSSEFSILTRAFHDYERLLTECLLEADVVYCCTSSPETLFDGEILTSHDGRRKGRLIVAVGSSSPEMGELPVEILQRATKKHDKPHRHFHKHAEDGGVVVVDTLEGALKESGEIIKAGIGPTQLVELGELVMLHRQKVEESETGSFTSTTSASSIDPQASNPSMSSVFGDASRRSSSPSSSPKSSKFSIPFRPRSENSSNTEKKKKEDSLCRWLSDGNVIYKSVGLGMMDLVVGKKLVETAGEMKVGTPIPDF